ncbi:MAG: hypothetical protein KC449_31050, partial [Anaerolineales bacterium]|nr:hypothetical protein [Anaerolineales bacterium]
MRKRMKRWIKRLLKVGGLFFVVGFIFIMGLLIGSESAQSRQTIIVRPDHFEEVGQSIEQRIERDVVA